MAIEVTCPGCQKTFNVSDQFAGKKGPCPSCKTVITIPTLAEAKAKVVIHAPEDSGPKDAKGRPVLKPISRKETKATPLLIGIIVGSLAAGLVGALVTRMVLWDKALGYTDIPLVFRGFVCLLLAPPLVFGGYTFLRDQELEPFRGRELIVRVAICSLVYAVLWAAFGWLPLWVGLTDIVDGRQTLLELPHLVVVVPLLAVAGGFVAFASLDLPYGSGVMHYALYLLVTVLLCLIAGFPLWSSTV